MKVAVRSFKCSSWDGSVRAWCMVCSWADHGKGSLVDRNAIKRTCARAKRHAETTGHEVRLDHTHQRGYRKAAA